MQGGIIPAGGGLQGGAMGGMQRQQALPPSGEQQAWDTAYSMR